MMPAFKIIREPVAEGCCADVIGMPAVFTSSTSLTAGLSSLKGLLYVIAALTCGIVFALLGSIILYETLRFAAMLLHIAL
jgi:hypothetical protein